MYLTVSYHNWAEREEDVDCVMMIYDIWFVLIAEWVDTVKCGIDSR